METVAVLAHDLRKLYRFLEAVKSVSFDVSVNTCFGFLGPNGAGKATTMRMIACAVPPTAGSLDVLGLSVTKAPRKIKSRLGLVPQEDNLDEVISVLDNLMRFTRATTACAGTRRLRTPASCSSSCSSARSVIGRSASCPEV